MFGYVLWSTRSVVSRQSLQGSTAFPVLAILSITSSCVTVPLTITFCVSRLTSKDSTPAEVSRSVGQMEPRGKARTTEPAERSASVVWRARGVAAPPAAPTRRRSSRGGVDAERFGSRGNPPAGEISEIAPSIFVRTRSTAPEHPAHIIATFKTIGSLIAASVR